MDNLKIAIVKQHLDPTGPWKTCRNDKYGQLKNFHYKTSLWELGTQLKAEWLIIKDDHKSFYLNFYHSQPEKIDIIKNNTQAMEINRVNFKKYDIVIALDPFFNAAKYQNKKTLFCYILNEEADPRYYFSTIKPLKGFDIYLDHVMKSKFNLESNHSSVSFPYPRDPMFLRKIFDIKKKNKCWIDRRVINMINNKTNIDDNKSGLNKIAERLANLGITVSYKMSMFAKPGQEISKINFENDSFNYLTQLAECRYYLGPIWMGSGQSLIDAATLRCICIGNSKVNYHKLLCHPLCLVNNINEGIKILKKINQDKNLRTEIINYQEAALNKWFVNYPKDILTKALEIKRRSL